MDAYLWLCLHKLSLAILSSHSRCWDIKQSNNIARLPATHMVRSSLPWAIPRVISAKPALVLIFQSWRARQCFRALPVRPEPHSSLSSFTRNVALWIFLRRERCHASTRRTWDVFTCVCAAPHPCPGREASSRRRAILTTPTCGSEYSLLKYPHMPAKPSPFP